MTRIDSNNLCCLYKLHSLIASVCIANDCINKVLSSLPGSEIIIFRNGASLPAEVEAFKEESKKFSKDLAVKLSRKMKLSELEEEVEKSKELKIVTHKTKKLKNIVEKAQKWMQEAQATIGNQVQLTDLGRLLSEARKMNVEYDITDSLSKFYTSSSLISYLGDQDSSNHPKTDLFEELKERHTTALSLISQSKSSSTVVESRKTRSKQKRSTKKETPHLNNSSVSNSQKTNILSSKISKEEATSILDKIDELKVSSQKVDLLREHLSKYAESAV